MKNTLVNVVLTIVCVLPGAASAQIGLTKIADSTTAVPGAPGTTFREIGQPYLHNGQVLFYATNNAGLPGLYLYDGNAIQRVADTNTPSPGGGTITNIIPFAYALENGAAAFVAFDTNGPAIFYWTNQQLTRLFKYGDAIPGTPTNRFTTFGQPAFDQGVLYFIGADSTNYRGVHRYDGVLSTGLVSSLHPYPGTALPHGFSSQLTAESNRLAFWSFASNNQPNAIFVWTNGMKNFLVSSNDAIPGAGVNFYTFQSPPDLQGGWVAFKGGSAANSQEGIFLRSFDGGAITPVVRRGDPNLGFSSSLTYFNEMAVDNGSVWFHAGGTGGESLFLWQSNRYSRLLSSGMKLDRPFNIASSGAFTFNQNCCHQGVAAFVARFADNSKALYLASNAPPPSPLVAVTNLAGTNTPVPGGTGNFTSISGAFLWRGGVVFNGNGTGGQAGLYQFQNGAFSVILDKSMNFPGSADTFVSFSVLAADESRLAIYAGSSGGNLGLFIYDGGGFTKVADMNTAIPGGAYGNFNGLIRAQFTGANLTFLGQGSNNFSGVYEFNGSAITPLVDSTSQFPGTTNYLRILNFTRAGDLLGLFAQAGTDASLSGAILSSNHVLSLVATNGAYMPGRTNRVYGFFNSLGFSGGEFHFTAQALSTVDSFSGTYVLKVAADGVAASIVVDETVTFPGILGTTTIGGFFIEPSGVFLNANNGSQRGLYRLTVGGMEPIFLNSAPVGGASVSSITPGPGSLSTNGLAFSVSTSLGSMVLYSAPTITTPAGGRFLPGSLAYTAGNRFSLTFGGATPGINYRVQYSDQAAGGNWITLTNLTYSGPLAISDTAATNQMRFYRAVSP